MWHNSKNKSLLSIPSATPCLGQPKGGSSTLRPMAHLSKSLYAPKKGSHSVERTDTSQLAGCSAQLGSPSITTDLRCPSGHEAFIQERKLGRMPPAPFSGCTAKILYYSGSICESKSCSQQATLVFSFGQKRES